MLRRAFCVLAMWRGLCYCGGMKALALLTIGMSLGLVSCSAQRYTGGDAAGIGALETVQATQTPARNVILMIGDGMGSEHVWAAWLANGGKLNITTLPVTGFSVTTSSSHLVTDSAAGGTAIACGCKTKNGQLGITAEGKRVDSLAEYMRRSGKSTGLVVTKSITDATPAAFYAHVESRRETAAIADALVKSDFAVIVGGGSADFSAGQLAALEKKCSLFELAAPGSCVAAAERPHWLAGRVQAALEVLARDKDGFFLMVEGSKIDTEAHVNNLSGTVQETLDFDRAVGVVLRWMQKHPDTLLVVTADHQTGGLSILGGNKEKNEVKGNFCTHSHSGVAVPVYAAGAGAAAFTGVQENTALSRKIREAAGLGARAYTEK